MLKKLVIIGICVSILCCLCMQAYTPMFAEYGETTVYLDSASSNAKIIKASEMEFKHNIKGESCFIDKSVDVDKILNEFNAKVVFIEEIDGTTNYYCYSKQIKYKTKNNRLYILK